MLLLRRMISFGFWRMIIGLSRTGIQRPRRTFSALYPHNWTMLIQWFIKLGIAWFLCRLSNNILQYGRWKNLMFWYVVSSFVCVVVLFWATCPPGDFISETLSSVPPSTSQFRCF